MNKIKSYNKALIVIAVLLVCLIGGTYAWLSVATESDKTSNVVIGTLSMELDDFESDGINIENATPVTDTEGLKSKSYNFTLTNNGDIPSNYTIYLDNNAIDDGEKRMGDEYVKYSLTKNEGEATTKLLSETYDNLTDKNKVLDTGVLDVSTTNSYTLKLWMDLDAPNSTMNSIFSASLRVEAEQTKE